VTKLFDVAGTAVRRLTDGREVREVDGNDWPAATRFGEEIDQARFDRLVQAERLRDPKEDCRCFRIDGLTKADPEVEIGRDEQFGRFGEVTLRTCGDCSRRWLEYFVEYEAFTASGRRFRGLVSEQQAEEVTAATAAALLDQLPWHFAWGSYFSGRWIRESGSARVDL
jgi:hypothetical protein